ncbi:MAG: undecaprenyl-diphosphate phosphatase [Deltaproteobacteria bacterium]|nr:undecaprenyl-diphosphate phosphatase [Deltaproteobacteria bacterium]
MSFFQAFFQPVLQNIFQTIVLALVQGITEFLPISSSAHLILVPHLLGWPDQGLRFDVAANTGSLLAVVWFFRSDLTSLAREGMVSLGQPISAWSSETRLAWALFGASIPVGLCGVLFFSFLATEGRDLRVIGTTSILFGLLLWWADRTGRQTRPLEDLRWRDAALVGFFQALALLPGTSRSGVTMTAGLMAGFEREAATRFAFLLAVPVGLMAAAKDAWELWSHPVPAREMGFLLLGAAVSAISAYLVIGWLLAWVRRQNLTLFVCYRLVLGVVLLAVALAAGTGAGPG